MQAENGNASSVYARERSDSTGTVTIVNYTTTWIGKVGLIYLSDFKYAGTTSNWLLSSKYYWTITSYASYSHLVWRVNDTNFSYDDVHFLHNIRSSLYLSANVKIIGGNGDDEPYKLSL